MSDPGVPEASPVSAPFWDATRHRRLVVQWCPSCDRGVHYPRLLCPTCGAPDLDWREMSGRAVVYAHATHHPRGPDAEPYCVALVDLAEGVRLLTNVVGTDPDDVFVGQSLRLAWLPIPDGRNLPVFTPEEELT